MLNIEQQGLDRKVYSPKQPIARVVLAHGAGAGNQHEFMHEFSTELALLNVEVISINFPYMQLVYELEKKRPPNNNKILVQHFKDELSKVDDTLPLFIAGKSMGGRIASQVLADELSSELVTGAIVLGYPFIPPGKPEKLQQRTEHFESLKKPMAILQGERDTFGGLSLLSELTLPQLISLYWLKSGDHSFKPLKSSGLNSSDNIKQAAKLTSEFINGLIG